VHRFGFRSILLFFVVLSPFAHAQNANDVSSTLIVNRVATPAGGKETSEPAKTAKPGDMLEYVAEYRNTGKAPAKKLEATLPIPSGTEYVPDSAKPAGAWASLDGNTFEPVPLKRKVKQPDGKLIEELVPYAEYRFLRWPAQDLPAGQSLKYSARAKLPAEPATTGTPTK
jgi:uncharacterized repeat protein (TIGR01451 family)